MIMEPFVASQDEAMTDPTQRRFRGSAKISEYEVMKEKLGEGTFGVVSKARSKRTGNVVALKKILMHNEKDGFPITALREVKLLKMLSHLNILRLEEMAVERQQVDDKGKSGRKRATLYMVTPYMDHDLSGMLTNPDIRLSEPQIKCYLQQLLEGLRYLHDSHILHRDMKAANILISNRGILQIADFGLARHYDGHTPQPGKGNGEAVRDYTSLVVTRWYRPPELLLTLKKYTPAIDMWGVGCVFGEMFERKPILEGNTDQNQCVRIFQLVGSPNDQNMPGWNELPGCEGNKKWDSHRGDIDTRFGRHISPAGLNLLKQLLRLDWRTRVNAIDALQHEYFRTAPLPARPEDLPTYDDSHELDARRRGHEKQRALPPAPAGGTVGMGPDDGHMNGYPYDRGGPRPYGRDRDRGPPPGSYGSGPPPRNYPDDRRQAWRHDRSRGGPPTQHPPSMNGHALPPRPDMPSRNGPPPPNQRGPGGGSAGRNNPDVDTYIPNYEGRPPLPPRESFERERERDRDRGWRGGSRERDGGGYRDVDAPPGGGGGGGVRYRDSDDGARAPPADARRGGDPYRERDRGGGAYGREEFGRRTRSRSPDNGGYERARGGREDDERRERLQARERDLYRR